MDEATIATNRFGLGSAPEVPPPADPHSWLSQQITRYDPAADAATMAPVAAKIRAAVERRHARKLDRAAPPPAMATEAKQEMQSEETYRAQLEFFPAGGARVAQAIATRTPFIERLIYFWSNHFAVSADGAHMRALVGDFENAAIRPHVTGNFRDMLRAVEQHPAMLRYLTQIRSAGPNSPAAKRGRRKLGYNENLAREIMELHTLGVRSGYQQVDVVQFALALTGWTYQAAAGPTPEGKPTFFFRAAWHEPGTRTVLGQRFDQADVGQGEAILDFLVRQPATGRHIATKLARHFAGDDPPAAMIERLVTAFQKSNGDLPTVYRALIASPEAWAAGPVKFKTPWEWTVSALRGLDLGSVDMFSMVKWIEVLGQPLWTPGAPAGFDDIAASWAGPDALVRRVEAAPELTQWAIEYGRDPLDNAKRMLGGDLSAPTSAALRGAESIAQGVTLALVAPEFLKR